MALLLYYSCWSWLPRQTTGQPLAFEPKLRHLWMGRSRASQISRPPRLTPSQRPFRRLRGGICAQYLRGENESACSSSRSDYPGFSCRKRLSFRSRCRLVGENPETYTFSDRFRNPYGTSLNDTSAEYSTIRELITGSPHVQESVAYPFLSADAEILEQLFEDPHGTVRFSGVASDSGSCESEITTETAFLWFAALALYQELGGEL